ncbi:Chromatin-associated swi6 [Hyphodiscus hymeniophilus]|uniref:Chromatin-associated swi6 n=1 Tax=Hyphodiscus hymeniophilus TaxID=353542 RepID=A0A9P6VEM3_9HELO|nr:Chromatin-associated swi6 [Hyphodiscus hymeniophilus]
MSGLGTLLALFTAAFGAKSRGIIRKMPHVALPPNKPGMVALGSYRPDVYSRLASLADLLLHEEHPDSSLSLGERELIAAYVSALNDCNYCQAAHGSVAAAHLQDPKLVDDVKINLESSAVSSKMKTLLRLAALVQRSGRDVSRDAIESAKKEGASDMDVHDTVLIAAMFCMFNRYVDGLDTEMPGNMAEFANRGAMIAERGYGVPVPVNTKSDIPSATIEQPEFKPPAGSWEDEVISIDTIPEQGGQLLSLVWKGGERTQHSLAEVCKRCPQKILKFYEQRSPTSAHNCAAVKPSSTSIRYQTLQVHTPHTPTNYHIYPRRGFLYQSLQLLPPLYRTWLPTTPVYALTTIHTLINTTPVLHVSFTPASTDPFPVILPLIGQMGSFTRPSAGLGDPLDLYLHGYVSSRIMNLARASPTSKGLGVCIAASKVDGLVLTLTPNSHNYNYRSAVLFGYATLVEDVKEKLWAMELITNSVVPDRWKHTRVPPNKGEMASTQILKVTIDSGSAKIREGVPNDEACDMNDEGVLNSVWTGVLPLYEQFGEPVPGPYNRVGEVPEHVVAYKERVNKTNSEYGEAAARKDAPVKKKEAGEED